MTNLIEKLATWREELLSDNITLERERNLLLMSVNHQEAQIQLNSRGINDIDRAIAALEPEAVADEWHEDFLALTDERPELFDEPQEIEASSQSESCVPSLGAETDLQTSPGEAEESRDQFEEEAERAAAIELTADVMPESGLHEEAPALNEQMQDERELTAALPQPEWNEPRQSISMIDEQTCEPVDPTLRAFEDDHIVEPQPTEGYAPVTNPEADALAKAHDWYDPKAVHDRNRFNPWGGVAHLFGKPKVDA